MISGSGDKTIRRWDLREGKEIEEAKEVFMNVVEVAGVSRDGRWVVTAGREVKVREVETGIVRTFHEGKWLSCIDVYGQQVALRLSEDSQKLAVLSNGGRCLEVWNVQTQKILDVQKSNPDGPGSLITPIFWTTKHRFIVAAFNLTADATIHEFDASTLETVGAPFKGHTHTICGLALSSDRVLLVSSSFDNTIKLWAFESRQLLASFDVESWTFAIALSPDSRQLAYTNWNDCNIYICNISANILDSIGLAKEPQPSKRSRRAGLLNQSDATRLVRRKPVITPVLSPISHAPRLFPTSDQHSFLRFLRNLFSSSSDADVVRTNEPRNPLDFPATSPLPRSHIKPDENSRPFSTQSSIVNTSPTFKSSLHRLSTWWPFQTLPVIADVPHAPGKLRYATAGAPRNDDDDLIRDEDYVPPPSPNPNSHPGLSTLDNMEAAGFVAAYK